MRELCQTHKLAIAPDGKCVLCRRPSLRLFAVREEHETIISRVFTGLLGVCLLVAASGLIYVSMLDAGYTGGRYVAGPAPIAKLPGKPLPPAQPAEPAQQEPSAEQAKAAATADAQAKPANGTASPAREQPARPVAVTMYATPWCEICDRAREFLLARDAVLTEYDIDSDRGAERRLAKLNASASVPTFEIAGRAYVGFNPWELEDAMRAVTAAAAATASDAGPGRTATARAVAKRAP